MRRMHIGEYTSILRYYAAGIFRELHQKDVFLWAQAIAFKVLVTFAPLVLVGTGLVALTIRQDQPSVLIEVVIRNFFPVYQGEHLVQFLEQLQGAASTLTMLGVVGLSVTGLTLFGTVRAVLANIFREEWHEHRSVWRSYVFDFRMALQVGAFFFLSIAVTLYVQSLDASVVKMAQDMGYPALWVEEGLHGAVKWLGWLLPLMLSMFMFFQLIYFTPIPKPPAKSAWTGAFVAAVLWEVAKVAFTIYATRLGGFQKTWFSALGSTFILILVLVFWAYYSGIVMIVGSITTLLHERKHRYDRGLNEPPADEAARAPTTAEPATPDLDSLHRPQTTDPPDSGPPMDSGDHPESAV